MFAVSLTVFFSRDRDILRFFAVVKDLPLMPRSKFQMLFVAAKKAATDYVCMSSQKACIDWLHPRWNKRGRHDVCPVSRAIHGPDSCNSPGLVSNRQGPAI